MKIYIEPRDWWIGYYRGPNHHYVCPIPCVVIRWPRRSMSMYLEEIRRAAEKSPPLHHGCCGCPNCRGGFGGKR